ncbi:MAG: hypothetical protein HDT29_06865 [Clostridiales bacterium]|nr:hypothetical protein [Clostridiales bacterium]
MITLEEAKEMVDKNYEYFNNNFEKLYSDYADKFIVIKDCEVLGAYDTFDDAYKTTIRSEQIGTFIIQHCSKSANTINYFHDNNVVFA